MQDRMLLMSMSYISHSHSERANQISAQPVEPVANSLRLPIGKKGDSWHITARWPASMCLNFTKLRPKPVRSRENKTKSCAFLIKLPHLQWFPVFVPPLSSQRTLIGLVIFWPAVSRWFSGGFGDEREIEFRLGISAIIRLPCKVKSWQSQIKLWLWHCVFFLFQTHFVIKFKYMSTSKMHCTAWWHPIDTPVRIIIK